MEKLTIAVGGGKGGVGKSIVAVNLAVAMAQVGCQVVLIDADLGGANLHTMFSIDQPKVLLEHFIQKRVEKLDDALVQTPQSGLSLICGGMPMPGTANPKHFQKLKLIRHIKALKADVTIIDIGSGVGFNVLDLFNAAESKIVVFNAQLTSLHNGYGFLKSAVHRKLQLSVSPDVRSYLQPNSPESSGEAIATMIGRLEKQDPEQANQARNTLRGEKYYLVGNLIRDTKEGYVIKAVAKMVRDYLHISPRVLGKLRYGDKMRLSINERKPFMLWAGIESNALTFRSMAKDLLNDQLKNTLRVDKKLNSLPPSLSASENHHRKESRFPAEKLQTVLIRKGVRLPGCVRNLSLQGALIEFNEPITQNASGKLILQAETGGDTIEVEVEERYRDSQNKQVGFAFLVSDDTTLRGIATMLSTAVAGQAVVNQVEA